MHQYHLGDNEEEKDGELVVSKVFYQTQPRQCGSRISLCRQDNNPSIKTPNFIDYYNPPFVSYQDDNSSIFNVTSNNANKEWGSCKGKKLMLLG